jgi:hypothetical protein
MCPDLLLLEDLFMIGKLPITWPVNNSIQSRLMLFEKVNSIIDQVNKRTQPVVLIFKFDSSISSEELKRIGNIINDKFNGIKNVKILMISNDVDIISVPNEGIQIKSVRISKYMNKAYVASLVNNLAEEIHSCTMI